MKATYLLPFIVFLMLALISTSYAQTSTNLKQANVFSGSSCQSGLTPSQLQTAYDFNPLYAAGLNGSGKTVAIIVAVGDPNIISDLNAFDSQYGLQSLVNGTNFFVLYPFGKPTSTSANWTQETALDVEVVHSMAPGAKIDLVVAPNDTSLFYAINYTINSLNVQTISISWGSSELQESGILDLLNNIFYNAYQKGIMVFAASGDAGAYNGQSTLNVNFPASDPYVMAVGGTTLSIASGGTYLSETAWSGSGGGESSVFSRPAYQPDLSSNRMVPDVAFNSGTYICAYVSGKWGNYYGTSIAAPAWAALDAILNQKLSGKSNQFEKSIYQAYYSSGTSVFHKISSGSNGYYTANGSYNMVTGVGTPIAYQLIQALSKTSYQLSFNSDYPGAIFEVNGINYTEGSNINFTAGQQITLHVYAINKSYTRYVFEDYAGLINSSEPTTSFFINSSGDVYASFLQQYKTLLKGINGTNTGIVWLNASSAYAVSSPLYVNTTQQQYTLKGISFDGGPVINSQYYSYNVFAPANITFVWATEPAIKVRLYGISNASFPVQLNYVAQRPLFNQTWSTAVQAANMSVIYPIYGTKVNATNTSYVAEGYRYAVRFASINYSNPIDFNFERQISYEIRFYSSSGTQVSPSSFLFGINGKNITYYNSSVWALPNSTLVIYSVNYSGFSVLSAPVHIPLGQASTAINLPLYTINVNVLLDSILPIPFTNVTLYIDNHTLRTVTNTFGVAAFLDVPDYNYSVDVNAGGQNYIYSAQNGTVLNVQVYPLLYQIYLAVGVVAVMLLGLAAIEVHRKHRTRFAEKL